MAVTAPSRRPVRTVGALALAVTLVGVVVGAGLFALPGELAASAGPAVAIAFFATGMVGLLFCIIAAVLGNAFPVNGAAFVAVALLLNPTSGFLMTWMLLCAMPIAVALLAHAFAGYLQALAPAVPQLPAAAAVVILFTGLNLLGTRIIVTTQAVMVAGFVAVLVLLCAGGAATGEPARLRPLAPHGWAAVAQACVPAFFAFLGFGVIIDVGGEVLRPRRSIPLALAASLLLVLALYCGVAVALVLLVPLAELAATDAALTVAAARTGWPALPALVGLAALAAAATSINGIILAFSRELYALGRSGVLPEVFARLSARGGEPAASVVLIGCLALAATLAGGEVLDYAAAAAIAILVQQILLALAMRNLDRRVPVNAGEAAFRLPQPWRDLVVAAAVLSAAALIALSLLQRPVLTVLVAVAGLIGLGIFRWRLAALGRGGVDVNERLRSQLPAP